MRVLVGGFHHETNTFAPSKAALANFERADSWPGLSRGEALLAAVAGKNISMAGFAETSREAGYTLLPAIWCNASPSAHVTEHAFETIAAMMLEDVRAAPDIDAVYLDLHGAMVTEHLEDGEGALLTRVRREVGPDIPIVASLDLHANVTEEMFAMADLLVGYRTYPHVDMAETGAQVAKLLPRVRDRRPAKALRKQPYLISINEQCTLTEPSASVMRECDRAENSGQGILSASFTPGFPPADIAACGPAVLVYGGDQAAVDFEADRLAAFVDSQAESFGGRYWQPEEAVRYAERRSTELGRPVVIADTQDNPGGGGDGDTAGMLHAMAAAEPASAVFGLFCDADAAAAAHSAGEGQEITLRLGNERYGSPFEGRFRIERLGDGEFVCGGPMYRGNHMQLGPMAALRLADTNLRLVVSSRKVQAADRAMFQHVGIEPDREAILILKSSVHFRADFGPLAGEIITAIAPGPVVADPAELPYQNLREGVRLGPVGPVYSS